MSEHKLYYVPNQSPWPILGAIGLGCIMVGAAHLVHKSSAGLWWFIPGIAILITILFAWFHNIMQENNAGLYSNQLHKSFRLGMGWFIFTEVIFFGCFFAALFYTRFLAVPWLGGFGDKAVSHMLWPNFVATWPLLANPGPAFIAPHHAMGPWPLPTVNTLVLLTSGVTITIAHHALLDKHRGLLSVSLLMTVLLGMLFLGLQSYEYYHAYTELGLTLASGIYGTTFFMLTGFHGLHVTLGTIMLSVAFIRVLFGHFTPTNHFAFEATAWYWHFVDVVWLFLFVLVYWM